MHLMTTTFAWIDLRAVVGLNTVVHHGPSCVDVKTVKLPEDEAYQHFLRGTGFSDDFIDAFSLLPTSAPPRISCFISYADQDEAFARRLCNDLQNKGVRCWLARQDLREGTPFYEVIGRAVSFQGKALLLLSQHVVQSKWVAREVENALKQEVTEHRNILSILRLDDAIMHTKEPWATSLRDTRPIGDFTSWQNGSIYRQRLAELLNLLKE